MFDLGAMLNKWFGRKSTGPPNPRPKCKPRLTSLEALAECRTNVYEDSESDSK